MNQINDGKIMTQPARSSSGRIAHLVIVHLNLSIHYTILNCFFNFFENWGFPKLEICVNCPLLFVERLNYGGISGMEARFFSCI
ncbi:MAG: hypothetical protein LBL62_07470, partial [Planctomycetaceae bacterium]|nr:hypothetical protein [Planctomycetaceae bacterium]